MKYTWRERLVVWVSVILYLAIWVLFAMVAIWIGAKVAQFFGWIS